jgi:hypothetical protein
MWIPNEEQIVFLEIMVMMEVRADEGAVSFPRYDLTVRVPPLTWSGTMP